MRLRHFPRAGTAPAQTRQPGGGAAYNALMRPQLGSLLEPAVMERATLLVNHVLRAEPLAGQRLQPHAGKSFRLELSGWPSLLPPPPELAWRVTPAGLLEWRGREAEGACELTLRLEASNPAMVLVRALDGQRPEAAIDGEAALAEDVAWLMSNLRWDLAADLERLFPPPVSQALIALGTTAARALHAALARLPAGLRRGA